MAAADGRHAGQNRRLGECCIQRGFPILLGGPASVETKGMAAAEILGNHKSPIVA